MFLKSGEYKPDEGNSSTCSLKLINSMRTIMANQMLLDAIDEVLSRLDLMSDEELQTKYDNHKGGAVGRVFLDAEAFLTFLENESVEDYTA